MSEHRIKTLKKTRRKIELRTETCLYAAASRPWAAPGDVDGKRAARFIRGVIKADRECLPTVLKDQLAYLDRMIEFYEDNP